VPSHDPLSTRTASAKAHGPLTEKATQVREATAGARDQSILPPQRELTAQAILRESPIFRAKVDSNAKQLTGEQGWKRLNVAADKIKKEVEAVHGKKSAMYSDKRFELALITGKSSLGMGPPRTKAGVTLQRRLDPDQERTYVLPDVYMTPKERTDWKAAFRESGANAFIEPLAHASINRTLGDTKNGLAYQAWGRDRSFVGTQKQANRAIEKAKNRAHAARDSSKAIESFDEDYATKWAKTDRDQTLYQYRLRGEKILERDYDLKPPTGSESGAYQALWIAGGKTKGGAYEGTVKRLERSQYHTEVEHGRLDIEKLDFNKPGETEKIHHQTLRDEAAKSDANVRSAKVIKEPIKSVSHAIAEFKRLRSENSQSSASSPFKKTW